MMADLFAQWPVVVVFTPLVTVLAAIIGWMIRFTITRQSQRDDKQEERMDQMAIENGLLRDGQAELANGMVRILERQNNLWDKVESGFDRMQSEIDRHGQDMKDHVAELKLIFRDDRRDNSEASERLRARIDALTGASAN